jgi:transcriptional regulator with XRE-family HTH domain
LAAVTDQLEPIDFNQRVAVNVLRLRKAANKSQAQLAHELALRGLPFQQQIIANVEKGIRPLKLEEAVAIGEILGVSVTALYEEHSESEDIAAAAAQLDKAVTARAMHVRQIAELEEEIKQADLLIRDAQRRLEPVSYISEGVRADIENTGRAVDPLTGRVLTRDDLAAYQEARLAAYLRSRVPR